MKQKSMDALATFNTLEGAFCPPPIGRWFLTGSELAAGSARCCVFNQESSD